MLFPKNLVQGITTLAPDGTILCRVFAAAAGIPEDPVTGSMYTVLGPYWKKTTGLKSFNARQCSTRGGTIKVDITDEGRVIVGGKAIQIMEGDIFI
jgi:predicted PhzF superfamily epimerase YddE/YHI9